MEPKPSKCLRISVLRDLPFSVVPWAIICLCPDGELALCDFSHDFPPIFLENEKLSENPMYWYVLRAINLFKKRNQSFKTYVIIGDGECNEGSIWEAAMAAPKFKLNNLFVIIDKNNYQQTGSNDEIMPSLNLVNKQNTLF